MRLAKRGFRRQLPRIGPVLLLTLSQVERLVRSTAMVGQTIRHLADRGIVHLGPGGKLTQQVLVKELGKGRRRYVCFNLRALTNAVE